MKFCLFLYAVSFPFLSGLTFQDPLLEHYVRFLASDGHCLDEAKDPNYCMMQVIKPGFRISLNNKQQLVLRMILVALHRMTHDAAQETEQSNACWGKELQHGKIWLGTFGSCLFGFSFGSVESIRDLPSSQAM